MITIKNIILLLLAFFTASSAFGGDRLRRYFEAREIGESCSVYLAVHEKNRLEAMRLKEILSEQQEFVRSGESILEECAKGSGIQGTKSRADLILVSQNCPTQMDELMTLEYSIENNRQDLKEILTGNRSLERLILYYCGRKA